jgi:hypothetical protein
MGELMRIGTWNLAGRWSEIHQLMLHDLECDVWLLTEVPWECELPGGTLAWSDHMTPQKAFACCPGAAAGPCGPTTGRTSRR